MIKFVRKGGGYTASVSRNHFSLRIQITVIMELFIVYILFDIFYLVYKFLELKFIQNWNP